MTSVAAAQNGADAIEYAAKFLLKQRFIDARTAVVIGISAGRTGFSCSCRAQGVAAAERICARSSAPLLEAWLREQCGRLSHSASVAEPIDHMLKRWDRFARFIDDGRICLTNDAAERAQRRFALGRKSRLFARSDRGAERAAVMATSG